uniref:LysM domain containing 2 n=1 Tax=Canis lupus familiaris TaxID=9615 RepID=A0A8C0PAF7_CANLF
NALRVRVRVRVTAPGIPGARWNDAEAAPGSRRLSHGQSRGQRREQSPAWRTPAPQQTAPSLQPPGGLPGLRSRSAERGAEPRRGLPRAPPRTARRAAAPGWAPAGRAPSILRPAGRARPPPPQRCGPGSPDRAPARPAPPRRRPSARSPVRAPIPGRRCGPSVRPCAPRRRGAPSRGGAAAGASAAINRRLPAGRGAGRGGAGARGRAAERGSLGSVVRGGAEAGPPAGSSPAGVPSRSPRPDPVTALRATRTSALGGKRCRLFGEARGSCGEGGRRRLSKPVSSGWMEQIKRANKLFTSDCIFLKKTLNIPVISEKPLSFNGLNSIDSPESETVGSSFSHEEEPTAAGEDLSPPSPQESDVQPVQPEEVSARDFLQRLDLQIKLSTQAAKKLKEESRDEESPYATSLYHS